MANPPASQSFPEVAAAIHARVPAILQHWESAVRQLLPTVNELTLTELRDTFPRLLAEIASALNTEHTPAIHNLISGSIEHGNTRFDQNYNLNEVLIEYHLL